MLMQRSWKRIAAASGSIDGGPRRGVRTSAAIAAVGVWFVLAGATAQAQPPQPFVPNITERSGLMMRFAAADEVLPHDPHRDNFYGTRYDDHTWGQHPIVKRPNWLLSQGLYGLGWKVNDTQSVYPYFYGNPGQSTVDASSRHGWRPLRFLDNWSHPWKPVGMYYQMGSYVPIYDLDPLVPGPGPYPIPFYFNWLHGG
jgi:hypothetical protein